MYGLIYSPRSQKSLRKFPKEYQSLILRKLASLKNNPKPRGYDKIDARTPPLHFVDEEVKEIIIVDVKRRTTQTDRH